MAVLKYKDPNTGQWIPLTASGGGGGDGGGEPGTGGTFTFTQATPAASWNITHNLGFKPNVQLQVNTADGLTEATGEIDHVSVNQLFITCAKAVSGEAYLS